MTAAYAVTMLVRPLSLLRIEGIALFVGATASYAWLGGSWWLFAALLFVPDLAMVGYARGARVGAALYNLAHSTALPILLALAGHLAHAPFLLLVAAVWLAHVGFDRALGYGLKFDSGFQDTHLGRIGKGAGRRAGPRTDRSPSRPTRDARRGGDRSSP